MLRIATVTFSLMLVLGWCFAAYINISASGGGDSNVGFAEAVGRAVGFLLWLPLIGVPCWFFSKDKWRGLRNFNVFGLILGLGLVGSAVAKLTAQNTPEGQRLKWTKFETRFVASVVEGATNRCRELGPALSPSANGQLTQACVAAADCMTTSYRDQPLAREELFRSWTKQVIPQAQEIPMSVKLINDCLRQNLEKQGLQFAQPAD